MIIAFFELREEIKIFNNNFLRGTRFKIKETNDQKNVF